MRKHAKDRTLPLRIRTEKPGDDLHLSFAGALTIAPPLVKKPKITKACPAVGGMVGWKPKGKWLVRLKRGSGTGPADRMTRGCDSLEDGRKTAEDYFKSGWDEAWVYEKQ
jgi:hypothetical protein